MTKARMIDFIVASGLVEDISAVELRKENKSYIQSLFFSALMHQSRKEK
jgi:hypothetical protein